MQSLREGDTRVENLSGYSTRDLERFIRTGARATGARGDLHVKVVPTPGRTRGCAVVGGKTMVLAIAPPSRMSRRKLARIFEHEVLHTQGVEHSEMSEHDYWSQGVEPEWSRGMPLRYKGKAKRGRAVRQVCSDDTD